MSFSLLFVATAALFRSAHSTCSYFNSGGVGIPLGFCNVFSQDGQVTPIAWRCDSTGDLVMDIWYSQQTCSGDPTYSMSYSEVEDVQDYECNGSGDDCHGVTVKMYDDAQCQSQTWSQMKLITDQCFAGQNNTALTLECDATTAEVFIYQGSVCEDSALAGHTSIIEADDRCTQIVGCDDPHALTTSAPIETETTTSVMTASPETTPSRTDSASSSECAYIDMGGSAVPLEYCSVRSSQVLQFPTVRTSSSFTCNADNSGVLMNQFSTGDCSGDAISFDPTIPMNIEGHQCHGSGHNCESTSVEVQIYDTRECTGDNWSTEKYVTGLCLEAADGGSHMYTCTDNTANILVYSDNRCRDFQNVDSIDHVNCVKVLSCIGGGTFSTTGWRPRSTAIIDPASTSAGAGHLLSTNSMDMSWTTLTVLVIIILIVVIISIVYCYRRKQRRLEEEIAGMTAPSNPSVNVNQSQYPYRQSVPTAIPMDNEQYMVAPVSGNANEAHFLPQGEGNFNANPQASDVVITAFAT